MKTVPRDRCVKRFAIAAMLALAAAPACAFSAPTAYLAEYRLYNEALARGDQAAAVAHSLAAWKAAEESLGDHKTTAVLAYNYGQETVFDDAAAALPAFERARALQDAGVADLPREDLAMFLAYATFRAKGEKPSRAKTLRRALEARDEVGVAATAESANIWLTLATNDITNERYKEALASAARAEASIISAIPHHYRGRGQAILLQGLAVLLPVPRSASDVRIAHRHFVRALNLFPSQKSIDEYDPQFVRIWAWELAAHSALESTNEFAKMPKNLIRFSEEPLGSPFEEPYQSNEECNIEWASRPAPDYPWKAARKGYLGAVLAGYRLSGDLKIHDARILAEVPDNLFGEIALEALGNWRLAAPVAALPGCNDNRIAVFRFVID